MSIAEAAGRGSLPLADPTGGRWSGNPSRARLAEFVSRAARSAPAGALVLDAGAGEGTYAGLFGHARYESADFQQVDKAYAPVTYVCDLADIPVDSDRYDLVVLTQVLEHLPNPARVLSEIARVLAPGGRVWLSAPLFYQEHEQPFDFYRYTQFGLRHLLEEAGLVVDELEWLEGYFATLSYQAKVLSKSLPLDPSGYGEGPGAAVLAAAARPTRWGARRASAALARLDDRYRVKVGLPKNYTAIASKPSA